MSKNDDEIKIIERATILMKIIRMAQKNNIGITHIQKYVYLFQKLAKSPKYYDFFMYNYGPYSPELSNDVNFLVLSRLVTKEDDPNGYGSHYKINDLIEMARNICQEEKEYDEKLRRVVMTFSGLSAKTLGLITTLKHVYDRESNRPDYDDNKLIQIVHRLKPQFTKEEIESKWKRYGEYLRGEKELPEQK